MSLCNLSNLYHRINEENLKIPGYIMYRVDHPSDIKRGRVYIYYKTMLPLKVLSTIFFQECINFEVSIGNKKCRFIHLYRTPSQSHDEFHVFLTNLEIDLDDSFNSNPFLTAVIGQRVIDQPLKGVKLISFLLSLVFLK